MAIGFHQYRHRRLGRRIQQVLRLGFQDHFTQLAVAAADSNGKPSPHGIGAAPEGIQNGKGSIGLGRHTHGYTAQASGIAPRKPPTAYLSRFRSDEHTSELQSLMRISYAVFCLKHKTLN